MRRSSEIEISHDDIGDNTKWLGKLQSKNQEGITGRAPFVPCRIRSWIGRLVKVQEKRERNLSRVSFPVGSPLEQRWVGKLYFWSSPWCNDHRNFRIKVLHYFEFLFCRICARRLNNKVNVKNSKYILNDFSFNRIGHFQKLHKLIFVVIEML